MFDENLMATSFESFGRALARGLNSALYIIESVWENIKPLAEKIIKQNEMSNKLTKNKFRNLLQASGIQRNEINKILNNNKEPYTKDRLKKILDRRRINADK